MSADLPVEVSVVVEAGDWPPVDVLEGLVADVVAAVAQEESELASGQTELSVVFSDDEAVQALNARWRDKDKPTNVLSFPAFAEWPEEGLPPMLGDVVLAFETVRREAELDEKPFEHHLKHLVVHGILHLLGHDHEDDAEAEAMETMERRVLAHLAIPDPYG